VQEKLGENFGARLKKLIGASSYRDAERKTGVDNKLLSLWCRGEGNPTLDKLLKIQKGLGGNLQWLIAGDGDMFNNHDSIKEQLVKDAEREYRGVKQRSVPVVASVPCGKPVDNWETEIKEHMELPKIGHLHSPFIVVAKGNSMKPYIENNDYLLCADEPSKIKNKTAVVVSFKSEPDTIVANAKLIKFMGKEKIMLYSVNTYFEPEEYSVKEIYKIYKVVRIIRDVN